MVLRDVHQATREGERGIVEGRGVEVLIHWHQAAQGVVPTAAVAHVLILTRRDPLGVEPGHFDRAGAGAGMTSGIAGLEAVVLHKYTPLAECCYYLRTQTDSLFVFSIVVQYKTCNAINTIMVMLCVCYRLSELSETSSARKGLNRTLAGSNLMN